MRDLDIGYAHSGNVSVAYTTVGDGPVDLVFVSGWILSNLDVAWEGSARRFFEGFADSYRLILFDKRGSGLSDRVDGIPDLQTRMDDVRAVMDAVGSRRAAILGFSEGGPMASLFAATYPERTAALVLYGTYATATSAPDYPWGMSREEMIRALDEADRLGIRQTDAWLDGALQAMAPSTAGDDQVRQWWRRWARTSASPATISRLSRMNAQLDVRHVLPAIRVPTLVLHREDDLDTPFEGGRYLADHIPTAVFQALPGVDHGWWVDSGQIVEATLAFLAELQESGAWDEVEAERVLATVLFTDIVDSTARLAELGDHRWRELIDDHHRLVRRQLARHNGREIDSAGDGFFAAFDGPARAIRCATAIVEGVRDLGLEVRAGLHAGECEIVDGKYGGIAVHIGARVASRARPGEVLVSSTVRDLVAGSGIRFESRGTAELKGVPGAWQLFAVDMGAPVAQVA
jgi:pimeloyl-ACP methyl ester carboxylesterase/class 3 adenylate cyclase